MKLIITLQAIVIGLGLSACSGGSGNFSAAGTSDLACKTHPGCLSIVHGHPLVSGGTTRRTENYLYLMVLCPGVKASENSEQSSGIDGDPITEPDIQYEWKTTSGKIHIALQWNTRTEKVLIGSNQFTRTNGNVFVIIRMPDGQLSALQCGSLGLHAEYQDAIRYIRYQCETNEIVNKARFYIIDK